MNDEPEVFGMNENANIAFQVILLIHSSCHLNIAYEYSFLVCTLSSGLSFLAVFSHDDIHWKFIMFL